MISSHVKDQHDILGFSPETFEILAEIYGTETRSVIEALKTPGRNFSIRVNLLKTNRDKVLQTFQDDGWNATPHPTLEEVVQLPISGPFELQEEQGQEVMVDKNTAEAVLRGADIYAPGITWCHGVRAGEKVTVIAPNGELIASGTALMSETEVLSLQRGLAVRIERTQYGVPSLRQHPLFEDGCIYPQTLPSILVSLNLQPHPDEIIVDMNASPGGKVTHLAELNGNRGRILAFDRHEAKILRLQENLDRMGITCVETRVADSRYLDKDFPTLRADAVLVDPPCSALGIRPKLYDTTTRSKIEITSRYQRQFLETAARILKPHGRILYSVCTMTLEECERQVESVCEKYGLLVDRQEFRLGSNGMPSYTQQTDCQRFHSHIHDSPGFFIALLRKRRG